MSEWQRRAASTVLVWAAYVLIALALLAPLVVRFTTHIVSEDLFIEPGRSDAYDFLWTYWWVQKAVLAGRNVYRCDWIFPPTGANLYFHTTVILPTILTLPLGLLFGPVGGYNTMIVLLLSGAASVYHAFLRHTIRLTATASFAGGALFGFSPYFLYKTHAHINMIGAVFWAGSLAVLVHAYLRGAFGWRRGLLFAACFWGTFWTSFVEFFVLVVMCAAVVTVFELLGLWRRDVRPLPERLRFIGATAVGAVSLLSFLQAPASTVIDIPLASPLRPVDLFAVPRLSIAWPLWASLQYRVGGPFFFIPTEYSGSHLPLVFVALAAVGLAASRANPSMRRELAPLAILAVIAFVLAVDPFRAPSRLIRLLPMGNGFRVFGRFLPLAYFFLLAFVGVGVERALQWKGRPAAIAWSALALLAFVELFPWRLAPRPVKQFTLPDTMVADARGGFTLIIPRQKFLSVLDSYQVSMDVPVVQRSYLSREDQATVDARQRRYPLMYAERPEMSAALLEEMKSARVRYVLYEDGRQFVAGEFGGEKVAENNGAVLARYP